MKAAFFALLSAGIILAATLNHARAGQAVYGGLSRANNSSQAVESPCLTATNGTHTVQARAFLSSGGGSLNISTIGSSCKTQVGEHVGQLSTTCFDGTILGLGPIHGTPSAPVNLFLDCGLGDAHGGGKQLAYYVFSL